MYWVCIKMIWTAFRGISFLTYCILPTVLLTNKAFINPRQGKGGKLTYFFWMGDFSHVYMTSLLFISFSDEYLISTHTCDSSFFAWGWWWSSALCWTWPPHNKTPRDSNSSSLLAVQGASDSWSRSYEHVIATFSWLYMVEDRLNDASPMVPSHTHAQPKHSYESCTFLSSSQGAKVTLEMTPSLSFYMLLFPQYQVCRLMFYSVFRSYVLFSPVYMYKLYATITQGQLYLTPR